MERRLLKPLVEWSQEDVDDLVSAKTPEGQRLEYKRQLNLEQPKDKHEAAKDVTGLANASGGVLIYGVAEEELPDCQVVPTRLSPLTDGSVRERLEDVLDSTVSPVLNLDRRLLEVEGGYVLLVRAFQRAGALHMVEGFKDGAHYLRVGHKTRRMAQHEIERAYANLSSQADRLRELLEQSPPGARLTVGREQHALLLAEKGITEPKWRPWMYVVTAPHDAPGTVLPMRSASPLDFQQDPEGRLRKANLFDPPFTLDAGGYLLEPVAEPETQLVAGRVRLYRSGVFEYGWRFPGDDWRTIPSIALLEHAHDALLYFARVYAQVGYHGRVRTFVGIDNADEGVFEIPNVVGLGRQSAQQESADDLSWQEDTNVDALLHDRLPIVHRAMDYIWQAFGHNQCLLFTPDGEFVPPRR